MKFRDELLQSIKNKIDFEKNQIQVIIEKNGAKTYTAKNIENRKTRIVFYENCIDEIDTLYHSLERLVELAKHDTEGGRIACQFLLSIFNSRYSNFNPRDLSVLDDNYWHDAINILKLDRLNYAEIHQYLQDGQNIFRELIEGEKP